MINQNSTYTNSKAIEFSTNIFRSNLGNFSDAYKFVKETITDTTNKAVKLLIL